ncbi:piggyBac transposable element-derived protein 1-like isoform X2 [Clinocottus analis]|uniref:piggyBac transposable element-derived protein 1-like isoform X2 n=1 Tax=Clinocottus analis TaxID=304258 RepID=UPI0035C25A5C
MDVSPSVLYGQRWQTVVVPAHPAISDDEDEEQSDSDDVADPDLVLTTHNQDTPGPSDMGPSVEVVLESDDDDDERPEAKRPCKCSKSAARPTTWHKVDINNTALPEYQHSPPDYIKTPFHYFTRYFNDKIISHITHQTNLYAAQKDINTTFHTNEEEIMTFVAILIYMGVVLLPAVEDYWVMETRVPQVANLMSSKRFRLLKRVVHFCDNTEIHGTSDRFFKVRPLFSFLTTAFLLEPQTPRQFVEEVMIAYKGKTASNLKHYIKNQPHKSGFKLFARASEDGFIHDMVLYQGKTTLKGHGASLTPEQKALGATSQIVSVLASSMSSPTATHIKMEMEENKPVTILSTNVRVEPSCPAVIRSYDANMRGLDKRDMLVHRYSTPMKSRRWYMRLFAYCIDVSLTNAWLMYRRDCKALGVKSQSLKGFRFSVFRAAGSPSPVTSSSGKSSLASDSLTSTADIPKPVRGHRRHTPNDAERFNLSLFHAPVYANRQTCKYCSRKGNIIRSNMVCRVCKVHLCINSERNCFINYHEQVA